MAVVTRKQLDEVQLKTELVDVPEWRTPDMAPDDVPQVWTRELMADERNLYESAMFKLEGAGKKATPSMNIRGATVRLAQMGMINADGSQLYSASRVDTEAIGKLPAAGLERVCSVIMRLSGITDEDEKELEKLAANFQKAEINVSGIS
jgi:hypothetical protein